ncbi:response regulator [Sphingomonas faeni]|uniref:response regulator n=1 Tax=Sphingomonas faeni TaxID=185950 RepID=UPI00277FDF1F|nr:response regulator [Sphingomonas faeni]MDQ0836912.1 chemotaxis response regulator CheB [Sphingomonas faeni]
MAGTSHPSSLTALRSEDAGRDIADAARVLIVDDSVVARPVIARLIDTSDRFSVVGAVGNVAGALTVLECAEVDFILLDIEMPGIDGLTALPELIAAGQGAKVMIVSSSADEGGATAVRALALGVADTLTQPSTSALSTRFGSALVSKLDMLREYQGPMPPESVSR